MATDTDDQAYGDNILATKAITSDTDIHWLEKHPECSVCLQPCLQPVMLPCTHIFCFLCVKGFAYRNKKCALCRRELSLDYFQAPIVVKIKDRELSTPSETIEKEAYDWFYEGQNGWWQYDERASTVLEEAFCASAKSCEIVIAGFLYIIDFSNMVQLRKSNPSRCRRIKRDKSNIERKGIAGLKYSMPNDTSTCQCKEENPNGSTDCKVQHTECSCQESRLETEITSHPGNTDIQTSSETLNGNESNDGSKQSAPVVVDDRSSGNTIDDLEQRMNRLLSDES